MILVETGFNVMFFINRDAKIRMFAVGIGNVDEVKLAQQGYSGYWTSASFDSLNGIISNITNITCGGGKIR